jgi:hypothetical protein
MHLKGKSFTHCENTRQCAKLKRLRSFGSPPSRGNAPNRTPEATNFRACPAKCSLLDASKLLQQYIQQYTRWSGRIPQSNVTGPATRNPIADKAIALRVPLNCQNNHNNYEHMFNIALQMEVNDVE